MQVITHTITYPSRANRIRLIPIGDIHLGNAACEENLLDECIKEVKSDPHTYWGFMGDGCDFIDRHDKRHRESHLAPWLHGEDDIIRVQRKRLIEKLYPIRKKCLWYIRGNHESDMLDKANRDVYWTVIEELQKDCPQRKLALGIQGFIRLRFQRGKDGQGANSWTVIIYAHHGFGGGRMEGSQALQLGRLLKSYEADVYLMGHVHSRIGFPLIHDTPSPVADRVVRKDVVASYTGAFLQTCLQEQPFEDKILESYAEEKGYPPLPTGWIELLFYPQKKRIRLVH